MTNILDVIDFEIECCDSLFDLREGSANEQLYIECKTLTSPFYNNLFSNIDLDENTVRKVSERLLKSSKIPTFHVIKDSKNEKVCIEKHMELYGSSSFMKCDLSSWNLAEHQIVNVDIEEQKGLFSDDFMDVFEDGFVNNKGIGYALDPSWIDAMKNTEPHEFLVETAFVVYEDGVAVSICSTSIDAADKKAFLFNVATKNDHRQKGYSRAGMVNALQHGKELGAKEIYLTTAENSPMQAFYESLGFEVFEVTRMYTFNA